MAAKMTIKANILNLGACRERGFNKPVASLVDQKGSWFTVFVSTDKNGEPRFARNGDVILNVRPQRD